MRPIPPHLTRVSPLPNTHARARAFSGPLSRTTRVSLYQKGKTNLDFYRAMLCIRDTSHGPVRLCLSVCPSVTSRCSTKTAKRRITKTTPHDTPKDSSFLVPKISAKFDRGHPLRGRRMQVGWVKIGDFRQIAGYISEDATR